MNLPNGIAVKRDFRHIAHKNGGLKKTDELVTWIESPLLFKNNTPDWKRTAAAIGEQLIINQEQTQQIANTVATLKRRHEEDLAILNHDLGDVIASNRKQEALLCRIRAHWSAFLLPRKLRQ